MEDKEKYRAGVKLVLDIIRRNRAEAERDGDTEFLDECEAGWNNIETTIEEEYETLLS